MNESDDFLERLRNEDQAAWNEAIARYNKPLLPYAMAKVKNRAVAEEVLQDGAVFTSRMVIAGETKIYDLAGAFRKGVSLALSEHFKRSNTKKRSARVVSSSQCQGNADPLAGASADEASPLDKLLHEEARQEVREAMEVLSAPECDVVWLKTFTDLTFLEIAAELNEKFGTVVSRYRRGLKKMRRFLEDRARRRAAHAPTPSDPPHEVKPAKFCRQGSDDSPTHRQP